MKVWVKLLTGSALGFALGSLLPAQAGVSGILPVISAFAVSAGRYIAPPMLVFSITIAIYELRRDGQFWPLVFRNILAIALVSAFVISAGILAALAFPPGRIPVFAEQQTETTAPEPVLNLTEIFPPNMLGVLASDGAYLFPLCVFAFFMAIGLSYDRNYMKPVISMIDSLSRVFYHIASLFSEIMGILIIAVAAYWAVRYHTVTENGLYKALLRMLLILSLVITFLILPAMLFLLRKYRTPWKALYASLGGAVAAFFSGDINFTLPLLIQQLKENMGVRRRANTVTVMMWTSFGRAGSAMTAAVSFMVIIKSYSSLETGAFELLGIGLTTFLISFILARNPGDAVFAALIMLCARYGRGFEAGYLILKPAAFYLISAGAMIDAMIISLGSFAVARMSGFQGAGPAGPEAGEAQAA